MSRVYKDRIIPARPETRRSVVSHVSCDLCGCPGDPDCYTEISWTQDPSEILLTTVALMQGTSHADGGSLQLTTCDICPNCFRVKLRPWLESQGAAFRDFKNDW